MKTQAPLSIGWIALRPIGNQSSLVLMLLIAVSAMAAVVRGQDPALPDTPDSKTSTNADLLVRKIEQVTDDYKAFLEKRKEIQTSYEKIQRDLRQSEAALNRINNEEIRQQMSAMQSMYQSANIDLALASTTARLGRCSYEARRQQVVTRQLLSDRMLENLNVTLRGQAIMQLDAAARQVLQNRYQLLQDAAKLDEQWTEWQAEWPNFMDKYWFFSDPERKFTAIEVDQAIAALDRCHPEDYAAKIATALLLERANRINAGMELIDQVIQVNTGLQPVALAAKAMLHHAVDNDKEAKALTDAAYKMHNDNPFVLWIRASLAASKGQWSNADTELKRLATVKPMGLSVRRLSALIRAARAPKVRGEGKKAILEAKAALDLEPQPSWYSHLVMAVAQASAKEKDAALASLEKAAAKADEGSLEWCNELKESIEKGDEIEWKFDRRIAESD